MSAALSQGLYGCRSSWFKRPLCVAVFMRPEFHAHLRALSLRWGIRQWKIVPDFTGLFRSYDCALVYAWDTNEVFGSNITRSGHKWHRSSNLKSYFHSPLWSKSEVARHMTSAVQWVERKVHITWRCLATGDPDVNKPRYLSYDNQPSVKVKRSGWSGLFGWHSVVNKASPGWRATKTIIWRIT